MVRARVPVVVQSPPRLVSPAARIAGRRIDLAKFPPPIIPRETPMQIFCGISEACCLILGNSILRMAPPSFG